MPTTNPVPSTDPSDLLFNAGKLDEVVSGSNATYTDRLGVSRRTMAGIDAAADNVLNAIGYGVPVAYASGISLTLTSQTVDYNGSLYAPKASALPFTTSTWGTDSAKFRVVQANDASLVTYTPSGTGAVAMTVQSKLQAIVTPEDFGAIGDGLSHPLSTRYTTLSAAQVAYPFATALTHEIDYCAIVAAINSATYGAGWYVSGPEILLRNGAVYYMGGNTLQLKKSVRIRGAGSGLPFTSMAAMKWAPGVTGIIVHRYNTLGAGVEATPTTAADGTVLEGFQLIGSLSGNVDSFGGHGIWLRARALCRDLNIGSFKGNGYNITATAGAWWDGAAEGNANNWRVSGGRVSGCENGIYTSGADVNAGSADNVDVSGNRIWGVAESAFLGNTYTAIHTDANGRDLASGTSAYATYGGNTYHAVPGNSNETLLATQPGTNANVWRQCSSTSYAIAWTGTNPAGTFREGGGLMSRGLNNRTSFIGCYSEGGQGRTWLSQHSIAMGGFLVECPIASGASFEGRFESVFSTSAIGSARTRQSDGRTITATVGGAADLLSAFEWTDSINNVTYRWQAIGSNGTFGITRGGSGAFISVRGNTEPELPNFFQVSEGIAIGQGGGMRQFSRAGWSTASGVLIPPAGYPYTKGDIILAPNPNAGDKIGCICTTGGISGSTAVFKAFGAIDA